MGKFNLQLVLNMQAEGEDFVNIDTEDELREALEGMLVQLLDEESIRYKATMENLDNGIKVCIIN
ncbi:MAG: hypothetical protein IKN66_09445 [Ruminococcus sp.]|nr:hypothetical protein [Ruminococcus sp.]